MEGYDGKIQIMPEKTDISKKYMMKVIPVMIKEVKENIASDDPEDGPKSLKTLRRLNKLVLTLEELLQAVKNFPYTKRPWRSLEIQFNNYDCIFYG
jgi:hypothetical protein